MSKPDTSADELTLRDRLKHLTDGQLETYHYDELEAFIKQRELALLERLEHKTKTLPTWETTSMVEGFDVLLAIQKEKEKL